MTCWWRIHNYAAIGICATGPGRARHGAAPAGLPGPIRLCEDLRIRHGQAGAGPEGCPIKAEIAFDFVKVFLLAFFLWWLVVA